MFYSEQYDENFLRFLQSEKIDAQFLNFASYSENSAYVITRRKTSCLILNHHAELFVYFIIFPYRIVKKIEELTEREILEMFSLCTHAQNLIGELIEIKKFHIQCNISDRISHLYLSAIPMIVDSENTDLRNEFTEQFIKLYEQLVEKDRMKIF